MERKTADMECLNTDQVLKIEIITRWNNGLINGDTVICLQGHRLCEDLFFDVQKFFKGKWRKSQKFVCGSHSRINQKHKLMLPSIPFIIMEVTNTIHQPAA